MVAAWYIPDSINDQQEENKGSTPQYVALDSLKDSTGVLALHFDPKNYTDDLNNIIKERGYQNQDEITCSPEKLENYSEKLKTFFIEHLHDDEEVRFVVEGSGYFDVRDDEDKWIRVEVTPGDLLVIPAGIYHRFTLDTSNYIKAKRLFLADPNWIPFNRPADDHPARVKYLQRK